jgi:hypothetical protein
MEMMTMTLTLLMNGEEAPNDGDYHEPQPQITDPTIGYFSISKTIKA